MARERTSAAFRGWEGLLLLVLLVVVVSTTPWRRPAT